MKRDVDPASVRGLHLPVLAIGLGQALPDQPPDLTSKRSSQRVHKKVTASSGNSVTFHDGGRPTTQLNEPDNVRKIEPTSKVDPVS
jgi:hypothetical protein